MKRIIFLAVISILLIGSSLLNIEAYANFYPNLPTITIKADGSIEPATAPILRNGNIYSLTNNIVMYQINVERDNIILDGNGFTLTDISKLYAGSPIYLESTDFYDGVGRNNVTIRNFNINSNMDIRADWATNCIITSNTLYCTFDTTNCSNNQITNNIFMSNLTGIWLWGSSNVISGNRFYNKECLFIFKGENNIISDNFFAYTQSDVVVYTNSTHNIFRNNTSSKINAETIITPPTNTPAPSSTLTLTPTPGTPTSNAPIPSFLLVLIALFLAFAVVVIILYIKAPYRKRISKQIAQSKFHY
jgi:parallel beta-helix repeat protein